MLNVVMLNVVMLSVIMLSVVMLSVFAPSTERNQNCLKPFLFGSYRVPLGLRVDIKVGQKQTKK
jgi:hypothetical protein